MRRSRETRELTAFVREVLMPGGPDAVPRLDPAACRFQLTYGRSRIHRWGIFAAEPIPKRRRVIEYTGQRIDSSEAYRRRVRPHIYLYWIGPGRAIDGALGGSGAEFINHSCEPNLVARLCKGRIHFVSLNRIEAGEELLVDYQIAGASGLLECTCGAPSCRGFINRADSPPARSSKARKSISRATAANDSGTLAARNTNPKLAASLPNGFSKR